MSHDQDRPSEGAKQADRLLALLGLVAMQAGGRLEVHTGHPTDPPIKVEIHFNEYVNPHLLVVYARYVTPPTTH